MKLFILATLLVGTTATITPATVDELRAAAPKAIDDAYKFIIKSGLISPLVRRNQDTCASILQVTPETWDTLAKQENVPSVCYSKMIDFMKVACSADCKTSDLTKGMFSTPTPAPTCAPGGRRLLQDAKDANDPSKQCEDKCFTPFVSSMLGFLRVMLDPKCAAAFPAKTANCNTGTKKPIASDSDVWDLEVAFGLLCTKNAAGKYCMTLFGESAKLEKAAADAGNVPNYTIASTSCVIPQDLQTNLKSLGCCWNTMLMFASMGASTSADKVSFKANTASLIAQAKTCSITLMDAPCGGGGVSIASVKSTMTLGSITPAQFDAPTQKKFEEGVAKQIGQPSSAVKVTSFKAVRRSGLQVESTTTLVGDAASSSATIQTKLTDTSAMQAKLQAEGGNLGSATVASSTAVPGFYVASSSSSDDSSSTMLIIIIAAAVVVVGAAVACYVMAVGKESATEKMVIAALPSMGEKHALTVEEEAAPPGAVFMKNGVWLDADGNPVE